MKEYVSRFGRITLSIVLAACSRGAQTSPAPSLSVRPKPTTSPEWIAKARADSLRHPYTQADVDFMSGMISHHAQAIKMADMAPSHGASQSVLTLTKRIINAQADEIFLMQQWLADRQKPVPDADPAGMKMMMNGHEHMMLMPGMLSDEQMKQLDAARGAEFDRLFLRFMIQHHRGAVDMVRTLFSSYGAGQDDLVFKFASDVNVDQTTEIARMEGMLSSMFGEKMPSSPDSN